MRKNVKLYRVRRVYRDGSIQNLYFEDVNRAKKIYNIYLNNNCSFGDIEDVEEYEHYDVKEAFKLVKKTEQVLREEIVYF